MSAAAFWSEVVECRRLLRLDRQIKDEIWMLSPEPALQRLARRHRFARWFLPWVVIPLVALPWWQWLGLDYFFGLGLVAAATCASILLYGLPLQVTTFLVLRMPSRRALYLANLTRWLPLWLWAGLWGTTGLLVANWGAIQNGEQVARSLLIGAQVPWLILGFFSAVGIGARVFGGWFFLLGGLFGGAWVWLQPLPALDAYLPLAPVGMLLLEIGFLALHIWDVGRVEPMSQITPVYDPKRAPNPAQQVTWPLIALYRGKVPDKLGPASWLVGRRGLGWAAAEYAFAKLLGSGIRAILIRAAALGAFIIAFLLVTRGWIDMWGLFLVTMCLNPFSGSLLYVGDPQRLYLLGVDYRCQLLHRLRTFWVTPVLLAASVAALLAAVLWGDIVLPLTLLGLVVGLTLLGEGVLGWPTIFFDNGKLGCWSLLVFQVVLSLWLGFLAGADRWAWLPALGWSTATRVQLFAAPCAALGLICILYKWWSLDEARLAELMHP
jgi:hypothetical protein